MSAAATTDPRISRTERELREAFLRLIETKSAYRVTVKELCHEAGINRATFYRHYQDMPDYIVGIGEHVAKELAAYCQPAPTVMRGKNKTFYVRWFEFVANNRHTFELLLGSNGTTEFRRQLIDHGIAESERLIRVTNYATREGVSERDLITYVVSAHVGLMEDWLDRGCKETPEQMADELIVFTAEGVYTAASA